MILVKANVATDQKVNTYSNWCSTLQTYLLKIASKRDQAPRVYNFFHSQLNWARNFSCS